MISSTFTNIDNETVEACQKNSLSMSHSVYRDRMRLRLLTLFHSNNVKFIGTDGCGETALVKKRKLATYG